MTNELLVDPSDLVHIDNTETINGLKYFSHDTVVANASQMITNCITKIPQDIKLELSDGMLKIKTGSKVYVPNGFEQDGITPHFDIITIENDFSATAGNNAKTVHFWNCSSNYFGRGIYNTKCVSGSTTPENPSNYMFWYNTANNIIKRYVDGSWTNDVYSLPVCIATEGETSYISIDQVFNGFGYVGSTVFALPGVKGLAANGKNTDETPKNIQFEIQNVITYTYTNNYTGPFVLGLNSNGFGGDTVFFIKSKNRPTTNNYTWLDTKTNTLNVHINSNDTIYDGCMVFNGYRTNNKIDWLTYKDTFTSLDYNDSQIISGFGMPSNKYITLTLGASGATYTAPANGYFTLFGHVNSAEMYNTSGSNLYWGVNGPTSTFKGVSCLAKKGDIVKIYYTTYGDNVIFRFIYAEGEI